MKIKLNNQNTRHFFKYHLQPYIQALSNRDFLFAEEDFRLAFCRRLISLKAGSMNRQAATKHITVKIGNEYLLPANPTISSTSAAPKEPTPLRTEVIVESPDLPPRSCGCFARSIATAEMMML